MIILIITKNPRGLEVPGWHPAGYSYLSHGPMGVFSFGWQPVKGWCYEKNTGGYKTLQISTLFMRCYK